MTDKVKKTEETVDEVAPKAPSKAEKSDRQIRFDAFLVEAEKQRTADGTLEIFLKQKADGEFDTIPDSFV